MKDIAVRLSFFLPFFFLAHAIRRATTNVVKGIPLHGTHTLPILVFASRVEYG